MTAAPPSSHLPACLTSSLAEDVAVLLRAKLRLDTAQAKAKALEADLHNTQRPARCEAAAKPATAAASSQDCDTAVCLSRSLTDEEVARIQQQVVSMSSWCEQLATHLLEAVGARCLELENRIVKARARVAACAAKLCLLRGQVPSCTAQTNALLSAAAHAREGAAASAQRSQALLKGAVSYHQVVCARMAKLEQRYASRDG